VDRVKSLPFVFALAALLCPLAAEADPGLRLSARLAPPITRVTTNQGGALNVGFGGVGLGLTTAQGIWLEGAASLLLGLEGGGYEGALSAGYAFHDAPEPHAWSVQLPVFATYRHAKRPSSSPTDGYSVNERMNLLGVGARLVLVRTFERNAFEIGLGTSIVAPVTRDRTESLYFTDPKTELWFDASLTLGFSFGL
jgi:hypothetical protein